jgi:hypothetical protein
VSVLALTPEAIEALRVAYQQMPAPGVVGDEALTAAAAAELRARIGEAAFEPYWLAHRGRYQVARDQTDAPLLVELEAIASRITGDVLTPIAARWLRLAHGDYILREDDPPPAARRVEAILDFSAAACGAADIVYTRRGAPVLYLPQRPRTLAVVDRAPDLERHVRYLDHRVGAHEVFRLELCFSARS